MAHKQRIYEYIYKKFFEIQEPRLTKSSDNEILLRELPFIGPHWLT
jgi:hypothetical protein